MTSRNKWLAILAALLLPLIATSAARAQSGSSGSTNFFGSGVVGFSPQISTITSGTILDAQAVVSADRKYVQMNLRPINTGLLALVPFGFQSVNSAGGLVGGAGGGTPGSGGSGPGAARTGGAEAKFQLPKLPNPAQITILDHPGMTRIGP